MSYIFDGKAFAKQKEDILRTQVDLLREQGIQPTIRTFVFREDEGSLLYTRLKKAAAERLGIVYAPIEHSITDDESQLLQEIQQANTDTRITGVMIQKPAKEIIGPHTKQGWWDRLTNAIDPEKDIDGLRAQPGMFLPATVKACLLILQEAQHVLQKTDEQWRQQSVVVLGRSDIVGKPLTAVLQNQFISVENWGKKNFTDHPDLKAFDIVISAVGKPNLITGTILKPGAIVIDVGAPVGDVNRVSIEPNTAFLTPVPGGVGPITVVCLMENAIQSAKRGISYGRTQTVFSNR